MAVATNILDQYVVGGKIARATAAWVKRRVSPGMLYVEIAEGVEGEIRSKGGEPAFPCGIGVGDVAAHYAPQVGDEAVVLDGDVVKVDFGVHIDGYVTDTSVTLTFNPRFHGLLEATERALQAAINVVRKDQRIGEVGKAIEQEASRSGFRPITNLSGHTMERYVVHAGKSIPNLFMPNLPLIKRSEVFAIEPFLTLPNASGYVVDGKQETIYSVLGRRRTGNKELDDFVNHVWEMRRTLPFTPRWFLEEYGPDELRSILLELIKVKVVRSYPTLVEASGNPVAQFEHTMTFDDGSLVVLT
jgi:methionyl aminopeptidase